MLQLWCPYFVGMTYFLHNVMMESKMSDQWNFQESIEKGKKRYNFGAHTLHE